MKVEIWSDVVCPWCYVGKRRFEKAVEQFDGDVEVTWRSFELDPGAPKRHDGPLDELLADKYRVSLARARQMIDRMTQMAAEEGLEFNLYEAEGGNTLDAHRLIHLAADHGLGDEMKERLLRAYMTEGRPISDRDELVDLATEVGLDGEQTRTALANDDYTDAVRADEAAARQLGCRGVPFFRIAGEHLISGAQPTETFLKTLRKAREELGPDKQSGGAMCDEDGCRTEL